MTEKEQRRLLAGSSTFLPRRLLFRCAALAAGLGGPGLLINGDDAWAKKKKRKHKKKKHGQTCPFPYFTCQDAGQECRLQGACCDSDPARNCAASHQGEGGNWVCCSHAGFGCADLDDDEFSCGACGHQCETGEHCLNGTCLT